MKQQGWLWAGFATAAAIMGMGTSSAQAQSLRACGNIDVEAEATCEVVPPMLNCQAECSIESVEAACEAKLQVTCSGECNVDAQASCTGSCEADCQARCTDFDPGTFDCEASCLADCGGVCMANCQDSECMAACEGRCEASCEADCNVELPSADCDAQCEASCEGSCEVEANVDCHVDCQTEREASCEVEVKGHCEADCQGERGALFCDGHYVDHGGNFAECRAALRERLDIEVTTRGEASGSCGDGRCEGMASGMATASCSSSGGPTPSGNSALWLSIAGLFALGLVRRYS